MNPDRPARSLVPRHNASYSQLGGIQFEYHLGPAGLAWYYSDCRVHVRPINIPSPSNECQISTKKHVKTVSSEKKKIPIHRYIIFH